MFLHPLQQERLADQVRPDRIDTSPARRRQSLGEPIHDFFRGGRDGKAHLPL